MDTNKPVLLGVSILSAAAGAFAGYKFAERQLIAKFEERLELETAEMKEFYSNVKKPYATPEEAVADLIPEQAEAPEDPRERQQKVRYHKIVQEEYTLADPTEEEQGGEAAKVEEVRNVFDGENPKKIYVIDQDDFMQNDPEHEQCTVTYFMKGGDLTDEHDHILDNQLELIGDDFVSRFGWGSSEDHIVHVRNDILRRDFEVVRSENSYNHDVLDEPDPLYDLPPHKRVRQEGR